MTTNPSQDRLSESTIAPSVRKPTELLIRHYDDLRRLGQTIVSEMHNHTVSGTALVNSTFVKFCDLEELGKLDKSMSDSEFFAFARVVFRRSMLSRCTSSRVRTTAHSIDIDHLAAGNAADLDCSETLRLLDRLAQANPNAAVVFELEAFFDLTREQIARVLGKTMAQVRRLSLQARAMLRRWLDGGKT